MIDWLLALALALTSSSDAEALRRSAPSYLDAVSAREHLAAARLAGAAYHVDADVLLAIAWRESRYHAGAVTREHSGKLSCGVMMITMPIGEPCPAPSVSDGYMRGAEHLRDWMRLTRDFRVALLGYAGGYTMIRACADGGELPRVRAGREVDLCKTPELDRAAWIRALRVKMETRSAS